jgi:hypothetical protein
MENHFAGQRGKALKWVMALATFLLAAFITSYGFAFTVNVVDQNGNPVAGFKWLLEEDNTHDPAPGFHAPVDTGNVHNNTLAISLHKSHAPVVASGEEATESSTAIATTASGQALPDGRYFISVLPFGTADTTYDMGGTNVTVPITTDVTVYVRTNPIETAQVSIKVFWDGNGGSLNNAPDIGEPGLAGFSVTLMDQGGDIVQDVFGAPLCGTGVCLTDANGEVIIKNLAPNKYGIEIVPPTTDSSGNPVKWYQTTTIEGTKTIDAWVRPNEPPFLVEFGPPFWHAFYGFTKEFNNLPPGGSTVTGQVLKGHLSRPPDITFYEGPPPEGEAVGERCLVGLNSLEQGLAVGVFAGLCEDGTGNFTIPNVAAGTYQLVIWDISLLHIISFNTVIADGVNPVDLGPVTTPMWFGQQEHNVFMGGVGVPEQNVNLRFRDGTIYQAFPTDTSGFVPFQAIFPFFHWQVAEVDFARFKATGLRVTNDLGGAVTDNADGEGKRNPTVDTQTGPVLTQAYQIFAGQNQRFEWTKETYGSNENGGISGIVFYATTRAEDDPRFAAGDGWEPGIPRVQVSLYKDMICNSNGGPAVYAPTSPFHCPEATPGEIGDGIPDPVDPTAATYPYTPTYADVDNYPQDDFPGPGDVDHNGNGAFDLGDAISVAYSDSWDDAPPSGCGPASVSPVSIHGTPVPIEQCAEGLRTWNQAVPGVFDGGYAFGPEIDCPDINGDCNALTNIGADGNRYLKPGTYIVQAATPPGYKLVKEEDRNVDFGPTPIPAVLPPRCVGELREVPPYLSFATRADGSLLPWANDIDHAAPFAGDLRPLCDAKKVDLGTGQNAATDFHLFTDVPKAARAVGLITDDFANELAPGKPQFTEKFSPPWISIAVFDYTGRQIIHTYGDEFGAYNWMAPSTYAINLPTPSGVGPKMHHFCLNYPFMQDGTQDPRWRAQYSTTCYSFNFEAGRTTYLDTPVIRQAAFVGALQTQLDCQEPASTPVIAKVTPTGDENVNGTAISGTAGTQFAIWAAGDVQVRNPAYPGGALGAPADPPLFPEFITRHYGFGGTAGTVTLNGTPLTISSWGDAQIVAQVPAGGLAAGTYQLTVTNSAGVPSPYGVTMTVGPASIVRVGPTQAHLTIQAAIDAAPADSLILVDPGTYAELPIVYKKVALQGAGAGSTKIYASHFSSGPGFTNPLVAWREKIALLTDGILANGEIGLLPGQDPNNPDTFLKDGEGPGIFVSPPAPFSGGARARIDGFTVTLADLGGAIYVNTNANRLQISNNVMTANAGNLGGGIRVGNPTVVAFARGGVAIPGGSDNPNMIVHHNRIIENGSYTTGGGIAIYKGADNYSITQNKICGNFARSGGGGIAHRGLSNGGTIGGNAAQSGNVIAFNEVFQGNQPGVGLGIGGGGGGIEIAGDPDLDGTGLTEGTGDVTISRNLIQGNLGGSADGGGIALRDVNGDDVTASNNPNQWHTIDVSRNVIVNNVTGNGGGGLSLQDAANVNIGNNTIADNDSTATSIFAGIGTPPTTPQPAGIVSRPHSTGLAAVSGQTFSDPGTLNRNILYNNRSFYWDPASANNGQGGLLPVVTGGGSSGAVYWDLGVVGAGASCLSPVRSRLTMLTYPIDPGCVYPSGGGQGNSTGDPGFPGDYFNTLLAASAADEGGNFVQVYYTPLGVQGNYTDNVGGNVGP